MAVYTLEIPDEASQQVFDAVCTTYGYDPASGQTQAEFTRAVVVNFLKSVVASHIASQQAEAARQAALAQLDMIQ